jgi:hypothetical protein
MAEKAEGSHLENIISPLEDQKNARIDKEVAKYASDKAIEIDEATDKRLKRLIDKRVLTIMVFTYFLQALDKGTMSFASIMGIKEDTKLKGQEVILTLTNLVD